MSRINIYFGKGFEEEEAFLNSKTNKSLYVAELIRRDMQGETHINKSDVEFIKENISNILDILNNSDGVSLIRQDIEYEETQHDSNEIIIENADLSIDSTHGDLLDF